MALKDQLTAEIARLEQSIGALVRPAGDPGELAVFAAQLAERARATQAAGVRAASLPSSLDFVGPAAARYAVHAEQSGTAAKVSAARLATLADGLAAQARQLQGRHDEHAAELRRLTAQRSTVQAQLRGLS